MGKQSRIDGHLYHIFLLLYNAFFSFSFFKSFLCELEISLETFREHSFAAKVSG